MREKILQKLDEEYEIFFLESMRNSKENLFAKSSEIEVKKEVRIFLREFIKSDEALSDGGLARRLYLSDNLMDACYRFVADHPEQSVETNCKAYIFQNLSAQKK